MNIGEKEYSDVRFKVPWGFISGRWYGNTNVRPFLALHGWLDNSGTFDRLIPLLPNYVSVLCIDLPGHGLSSKMPKGILYNHIHFLMVIRIIMREYKWDKISLIGHSMGGILSFLFVLFYPKLVDMIISIDIIKTRYHDPSEDLSMLNMALQKALIEDDRLNQTTEPPSYSYDQMKKLLHAGCSGSIELENCKFILDRNISKSQKYPEKYFFLRDGRVKNLFEFKFSSSVNAELAKNIPPIPYLVIKGKDLSYIDKNSNEVISVLERNNPNFEIHKIAGSHHLHLNNPKEVSEIVNQFIKKHLPSTLLIQSDKCENVSLTSKL